MHNHEIKVTIIEALTNRKTKEVTETVSNEKEGVVEMSTENPARVKVGATRTYNLGPYESLRIEVSIDMPCEADDVGDTFKELATKLPGRVERTFENYCTKAGIEIS